MHGTEKNEIIYLSKIVTYILPHLPSHQHIYRNLARARIQFFTRDFLGPEYTVNTAEPGIKEGPDPWGNSGGHHPCGAPYIIRTQRVVGV